jgi:DMSO reductase family type II enzyme chaperone
MNDPVSDRIPSDGSGDMTSAPNNPARPGEIEVALARSHVYLWLSRAVRYPDAASAAMLSKSLPTVLAPSLERLDDGTGDGLRRSLDGLRAAPVEPDLAHLQSEHRRVFGHIESSPCPPYETRYGTHHLFQQTQQLADIAGFYRAFGLTLSREAHERPDHLAIELEFLHFLSFKTAYALQHHGPEQADLCRDAEQKFLSDHLLQWAPSFARRLEETAGGGWYGQLAGLLSAFLSTEAARQGCPHPEDLPLQPVAFPPEGGTFSCGVGPQDVGDLISQA